MAFFGLTQLGEQQFFRANSTSHGIDLTLFVEKDMLKAFEALVGKKNKDKDWIVASEIDAFLTKLYQGPLRGKEDLDLILGFLGNPSEDTRVGKDELICATLYAQEETRAANEKKPYSAAQYRSLREVKERADGVKKPTEMFVNPVTTGQEYGWLVGRTKFAQLDKKISKSYPKKASPETAFADAMAAAGNI